MLYAYSAYANITQTGIKIKPKMQENLNQYNSILIYFLLKYKCSLLQEYDVRFFWVWACICNYTHSGDPVLPPLLFAIICLFNKYVLMFYVLHIRCMECFTSFAPGANDSVSQHLLLFLVPNKECLFTASHSQFSPSGCMLRHEHGRRVECSWDSWFLFHCPLWHEHFTCKFPKPNDWKRERSMPL